MSSIESEWRRYLLQNKIIEGPVELKKREGVLALLRSLIPSFIRHCVKENNIERTDFTCQLKPFGSFGLGGHIAGGDIDLVLLAPLAVRRRDFFEFFSKLLKSQPIICEVENIIRANVPIIKCSVDSIPIDISFVRLQMRSVPADIDLLDDSVLRNLDSTCLASTDGPRVNQFILKHVYPNDMSAFCLALQCVKYWAKQRCLYGKPMGFLNGGAWTLLLMKTYLDKRAGVTSTSLDDPASSLPLSQQVCSSHGLPYSFTSLSSSSVSSDGSSSSILPSSAVSQSPLSMRSTSSISSVISSSASASSSVSESTEPFSLSLSPNLGNATPTISFITLLRSFFSTWSTWSWPDPVILTKAIPITPGPSPDEVHSVETLDTFKNSLLPIATPCYPVTSAAPFVTKSTLSIIVSELDRVHQLLVCDDPTNPRTKMDMIFQPLHIIKEFKHFIKVTVCSETLKSHDIWARRMMDYLPRLMELLEAREEIAAVRPLTKSYKSHKLYQSQREKDLLRQGQLQGGNINSFEPLPPGSLYLNCFLVGIGFYERYKRNNTVIDLSDLIQSYCGEIVLKMKSMDVDVSVHLSAIKRREVDALIRN